jgi:uncharacterized protein YjbI with pentapeptide repeats
MRIIKPQKLGLIHRTFSVKSVHTLAVAPVIFFELLDSKMLVSESVAWSRLMKALPLNQGLDEGMPKANAEFVLVGQAYTTNEKSDLSVDATVSIGEATKMLRVTGNRTWNKGFFRRYASPPASFKSLPLTWLNAFGGADIATNPMGAGVLGMGEFGESIIALPNISYPNEELTSPKSTIRPASFGPIDVSWKPRSEFSGTYDDEYFEQHFPNLAPDLDFRLYNLAPEDQQFSNRFKGDESYQLINLHPDSAVINGVLPGLRPRVFRDDTLGFREVDTQLETVWFLPEVNLGAMIFRGTDPSEHRHAAMVTDHLMVVYENLKDPAQDLEHYEVVLRERMNPDTAAQHLMNESELSPLKSAKVLAEENQELVREIKRQNDAQNSLWEQYRLDHKEETGDELPDHLSPVAVDPDLVIAPESVTRGDVDTSKIFAANERKIEEATAVLNKPLKDLLSDVPQEVTASVSDETLISEAVRRARKEHSVTPSLSDSELPDAISAPEVEEFRELDLAAKGLSITPSSEAGATARIVGGPLREVVQELMKTGESLANRDLTGVNLSYLDLSKQVLDGSILASADLRGTNFQGTSLAKASLVGALLDGANFSSSDLTRANLSSSLGRGVNFRSANLNEMQCQGARLEESDFGGTNCARMVALGANLKAADFTGSCLQSSSFMNANLMGSDFVNVDIERCTFLNADLMMTRWHQVTVANSALYNTRMQLVSMIDCKFKKVQFAGETYFTSATLKKTLFEDCGFRGLSGSGLDLTESTFLGCDLGQMAIPGSKMTDVALFSCHANGADFSNGNLQGSSLTMSQFAEANFSGCDLRGVNFYESDVLLSDLSNTDYSHALNIMPLKLGRLDNERRRVA